MLALSGVIKEGCLRHVGCLIFKQETLTAYLLCACTAPSFVLLIHFPEFHVIILSLWMQGLRFRNVKSLLHHHTAGQGKRLTWILIGGRR